MRKFATFFVLMLSIFAMSVALYSVDFAKAVGYPTTGDPTSQKGGAVIVEAGSTYTLSGGEISGKSRERGGAIYVSNGATLIMDGGTISGCSATYGGGIYVEAGATCTITGGTITGCTADYGPAIYVEKGANFSCTSPNINKDDIADKNHMYSLGTIPSKVAVKKNGVSLQSGADINEGDVLEITYTIKNDYYISVKVAGASRQPGTEFNYIVEGDVTLEYFEKAAEPASKLVYTLNNDVYEVKMTDPDPYTGDIVIPNYHAGVPVRTVARNGFKFADSLNIYIPETITKACDSAFWACSKSTKVIIPESLEVVEYGAFFSCKGIKGDLKLTNIVSVADMGFDACGGIENLYIGPNLTTVVAQSFAFCYPDKTVVDKNNKVFTSRDNSGIERNVLVNKNTKTLIIGNKEGYIPDDGSVTSLGGHSFACFEFIDDSLFVIPDTILSIGRYACYGINSKAIKIGKNVKSIGEDGFFYCINITEIEIPDSVISIGSSGICACKALRTIKFGSGLQTLGSSVFYNDESLIEVTIPDSVTTIGSGLFGNCTSLQSITFGRNLTSMPSEICEELPALKEVTINCTSIAIGDYSFYKCSNLQTVNMGTGVTSIGSSAFSGCTLLPTITIPDKCTTISSYAFAGCSNLQSIRIGSGLKNIYQYAFNSCASLNKVYYHGNATTWNALKKNIETTNNEYFLNASVEYVSKLFAPEVSWEDVADNIENKVCEVDNEEKKQSVDADEKKVFIIPKKAKIKAKARG